MNYFSVGELIRIKLDVLVFRVHLALSDASPRLISTSIPDYIVLISLYGRV